MTVRVGIGQESHRFLPSESSKPCIIGGLLFEEVPGLSADSDGDVVCHALCNAITSLTGIPVLEGLARDLCFKDGITDSQTYVEKAVETLGRKRIVHIAFSIEGKRPSFEHRLLEMRQKLASLLHLRIEQIGVTAISGDGLTDVGCGDGLQCLCILTTQEI